MKVKRFVAFSGADYYPSGGWGDFFGSFDTRDEAVAALAARTKFIGDWTQIVDLETGEDVAENTKAGTAEANR
jgi:hypothetical protein